MTSDSLDWLLPVLFFCFEVYTSQSFHVIKNKVGKKNWQSDISYVVYKLVKYWYAYKQIIFLFTFNKKLT